MEAFDLKKALEGQPVKLRNGSKAYIKYRVDDNPEITQKRDLVCPLVGYWIKDGYMYDIKWSLKGEAHFAVNSSPYSIESMWQGSRPRVQLDLPCTLKELSLGEHYYYVDFWIDTISKKVESIVVCGIFENSILDEYRLNQGRCFATEEDAQEWLDAMRNARR